MVPVIRNTALICFSRLWIAIGCWAFSIPLLGAESTGKPLPDRIHDLLSRSCFECHSHQAEKLKAGLMLDSRSGFLTGGDSGPALVPGNPDESLLLEAVRYGNVDLQMPPRSRLADEEIALLEEWIRQGAPWNEAAPVATDREAFDLEERRQSHWAWQPVERSRIPTVDNEDWAQGAIDRFILAELEKQKMQPADRADDRTLIRRLYLMLTGLPPEPSEVDRFAEDTSPGKYREWVDQILKSKRFGERWARHWMDVARYAETLGHEFDYDLPNAWRYRDYLIRAFNEDVPYDRFITEHLAGDLIEDPRRLKNGLNESAVATAFYWFGQQVHSPVDIKGHQLEVIDNQIDTLSRSFQALTVSCARCHDHKFDAISTKDFYALYGVMESSRYHQEDLREQDAYQQSLREMESLRRRLQESISSPASATSGKREDSGAGGLERFKWFPEGMAFTRPQIEPGEVLDSTDTNGIAIAKAPGYSSRTLSRQLEGALRSSTFTITNRFLHLHAAGKGTRAKVVIETFQLIRDPIYGGVKKGIDLPDGGWLTFDLEMWRGHQAYLELLDQRTPDLADTLSPGGYPDDAWFDLYGVVLSNERQPPSLSAPMVESIPTSAEQQRLLERWEEMASRLPQPVRSPAMTESEGIDEHVFVRGSPGRPGDLVERRYLEALGGLEQPFESGSGRLALADAIASPDNPLTARVWVNRVWHHLFGRGLVATVDDFGVLGEEPSHPELLDWLADWFVQEGQWSTRELIRLIVSSAAWQQSAEPADPRFDVLDPDNVMIHKWTVRRLEGEAIRDSILKVAGTLNPEMYGPSVPVHLTDFMTGRGRPGNSGPLDGNGRRSIYIEVRRNFMPPMMLAFDTPQTAQTFGRRAQSNVPAQALILMNDPFVHQQAGHWADRLFQECSGTDPLRRIQWLYRELLQRDPSESETKRILSFLESSLDGSQKELRSDSEAARAVWRSLCHVLFNTKEFVFVN